MFFLLKFFENKKIFLMSKYQNILRKQSKQYFQPGISCTHNVFL